jgi:hypothetical protein
MVNLTGRGNSTWNKECIDINNLKLKNKIVPSTIEVPLIARKRFGKKNNTKAAIIIIIFTTTQRQCSKFIFSH